MQKGGSCLDQVDSDWFTVYPLRDLTCSMFWARCRVAGCCASKLQTLEDIASPAFLLVPPKLYGPVADSWQEGGLLKYLPSTLFTGSPWDLQVHRWNLFLVFEKLQPLWMIYGITWSYKSCATAKCNNGFVCIIICVSFAWPHLCQCWITKRLCNSWAVWRARLKWHQPPRLQKGTVLAAEGNCPSFSRFLRNYQY